MLRRPVVIISHWYILVEALQASTLDFYKSVDAVLQRRAVPNIKTHRVLWQEGGALSAQRRYFRVSRGQLAFDICAAPFGNDYFFSWWLARTPPKYGWAILLLLFVTGAGVFNLICDNMTVHTLSPEIVPWLRWAGPWMIQVLGVVVALLATLIFLMIVQMVGGHDAILAIPLIGVLYEVIFAPATYYRIDTALMFQEAVRTAVMEAVDSLMTQKGLRKLSEPERQPRLNEKLLG